MIEGHVTLQVELASDSPDGVRFYKGVTEIVGKALAEQLQGRFEVYDETVAEVAEDMGVTETWLREKMSIYLRGRGTPSYEALKEEEKYICYAVYRVVKLKYAFRATRKSRERWRERAMELGNPPHLVREKA
jgi:hypothetical protein